jgi:hypothetical protein
LPRASYVEDVDLVFVYKIDNQLCRRLRGEVRRINQLVRMLKLLATPDRVVSAAL